jgi:hypothetical protein
MADYTPQWTRFRQWNRIGLRSLLLMVVSVLVVICLLRFQRSPAIGLCLFALSWIGLLYCISRQSYFRCPRCNELFSWRHWPLPQSLRRRCVHCGLRLYQEAE